MSTILVVDDVRIFREPIAASLRLAGYETLAAANGIEAREVMARHRVDLILLDLAMPAMDGLAFLEFLRGRSASRDLPVIMLSAHADRAKLLRAARLGVRDYLLKSQFSLKELLERIGRYLPRPGGSGGAAAAASRIPGRAPAAGAVKVAPKPGPRPASSAPAAASTAPPAPAPQVLTRQPPQLLTREASLKRIENALQARSLSGVVAQVIGLAASPRGDLSDLAGLIARDPGLAARVVRAANSAAFRATRGVVATIPEAVRNIGCATVRNLAAAMGVIDAMPEPGPDGFDPIRCWQHSFAVAHLCERLAEEGGAADPGAAYLVGLCHDLCEVLVRTTFAAEHRQLLELAGGEGGPAPDDEDHRRMFGLSRGEMTGAILKALALPAAIGDPIRAFHGVDPDDAGLRRTSAGRPRGELPAPHPLTGLLRLADAYANGLQLASIARAPVRAFDATEVQRLAGLPHPARPDGSAMRDEVLMLTTLLARLPADGSAATSLAPPHPRGQFRVCLARDPGLSRFDPVLAALESMADCQVLERLPAADGDVDRGGAGSVLVVLARHPQVPGFERADVARAAEAMGAAASVLWLVGRGEGGVADVPAASDGAVAVDEADDDGPRPIRWPITLDVLARLVSGPAASEAARPGTASGRLVVPDPESGSLPPVYA